MLVSGPPWSEIVYVPPNSTVQVNCTIDRSAWLIDLLGDSDEEAVQLQFIDSGGQLMKLNDGGFFELPPVAVPPTRRLFINDTAMNNQTEILCTGVDARAETKLFVYGK